MSALTDLQFLYASDPDAVAVDIGTGSTRCRGFLSVKRVLTGQQADGFGVTTQTTMLRVLAGSLGTPSADATCTIGSVGYHLLALEPADGDGNEELALLAKVTV